MKKILFFLILLIPFLSKAQSTENIYLAGSTGSNKVIARNDFSIAGTTYLGLKDTTFTPAQNGAIVCRPQDGRLYEFILNAGNEQWWALGIGVQNIGASNMMHARNDTTFVIGGKADTTTVLELSSAFSFSIDSAGYGTNTGFRVNFTNDQPWDMFMRDSVSGFWRAIHPGTVGYVLSRASTGGYAWIPQSSAGSPANLAVNPTSTTLPVTNSNGTGFTINPATHLIAGSFPASDKAREDSTTNFVNYAGTANYAGNYGDSLAFSSLGHDTIGLRRILLAAGRGISMADSSSLQQIYKTFSLDTGIAATRNYVIGTYLPFSLVQGSIWVGNSSGVAAPLSIGTNGQVPVSTGTGIVWQNQAAGFANPMTTLGDIISQGSSGATRLAGNTSTTIMLLRSLGNGTVASGPSWYAPGAQDVAGWQGFTSENVSNKSTTTTLGTSNSAYPTQNAVKTYVDNQASATLIITNKTISGATNTISNLTDGSLALTNVTTNNASTSAHGFLPILPGNSSVFLNGNGAYTVPTGTNIYNTDGVVSNTRTASFNGNTVTFNGGVLNLANLLLNTSGTSSFVGNVGTQVRLANNILDNGFTGSGGTRAAVANMELTQPSISAINTNVTYTKGANLYIDGPPTSGTNVAITNPYSFYVASGKSSFNGIVQINDGTQANSNVFTSDANGNGSWQVPNNLYNNDGSLIAPRTINQGTNALYFSNGPLIVQGANENSMYFRSSTGNFGFNIGRSPNNDNANVFFIRLEGVGTIQTIDSLGNTSFLSSVAIKDGTQAAGKVFTSDANGKGSWQVSGGGSSGSYTPTITSGSNLGGSTAAGTFFWTQVGNIVSVTGEFSNLSNVTGGTPTSLHLSLPVTSNFTSQTDAAGLGEFVTINASQSLIAQAVLSGTTALVYFTLSSSSSGGPAMITFKYLVH